MWQASVIPVIIAYLRTVKSKHCEKINAGANIKPILHGTFRIKRSYPNKYVYFFFEKKHFSLTKFEGTYTLHLYFLFSWHWALKIFIPINLHPPTKLAIKLDRKLDGGCKSMVANDSRERHAPHFLSVFKENWINGANRQKSEVTGLNVTKIKR